MSLPWLVLGASGQVGYFLLRRLAARGDEVVAVTRGEPPAWAQPLERVRWVRGDLFRDCTPPGARTLLSAGPLDGLAAWLERDDVAAERRDPLQNGIADLPARAEHEPARGRPFGHLN